MPRRKSSEEIAVDVERLLTAIQRHPVLYNLEDPSYRDKEKATNVWTSIGRELKASGGYNVMISHNPVYNHHMGSMRRNVKTSQKCQCRRL